MKPLSMVRRLYRPQLDRSHFGKPLTSTFVQMRAMRWAEKPLMPAFVKPMPAIKREILDSVLLHFIQCLN